MLHYMKLKDEPFEKIKSGQKTIEMRLYDEKRKLIKENDVIEFTNISSQEKIMTKVLKLYLFPDFTTLYNVLPLEKCGYSESEIKFASPDDMNQYYSQHEQKEFGVVGIEIELIK